MSLISRSLAVCALAMLFPMMAGAQTCMQFPAWSSDGEQIFSPYGVNRSGRPSASRGYHQALDIANNIGRGDPIYAGVTGRVIVAGGGKGGNRVVVETTDGRQRFGYFHLDAIHPSIRVGTEVSANTQVGTMGADGVQSGKVHVHFIKLLDGQTLRDAGANSRVWSSPHGWTGTKHSPPMTAEAIRSASPNSFYFVNPETYLEHRIPFNPGTLAVQTYIDQGLDRPDGLSLPPTCTPSSEIFSAPARSVGLGSSAAEIGAIMAANNSDIGHAVDMASGESRDAILNMAKMQAEMLMLSHHMAVDHAQGFDQAWAGLILSEIDDE